MFAANACAQIQHSADILHCVVQAACILMIRGALISFKLPRPVMLCCAVLCFVALCVPFCRLLKQCGAAGLSQIFKVEIDSIMLGQVVQVVQQQWQQQAMQQQQRQCDATVEQPSCTTAGGPALEQQQQDNASAAAALVSEAVEVVMLLQSLAGTDACMV